MKNRYLKIACVSVFVCIISLTLMGISGDRESMAVEQLLIKRTDIMENVLSGNLTYEEGKLRLKEVEYGKLYSDDIKKLADNMNCEHNKVIGMKIDDLRRTSGVSDLTTYQCGITWKCSGINGIYVQKCDYTVAADQSIEGIKLVSFEIDE